VQTATVAGASASSGPPTVGGTIVPFFYGTNQYAEKFNATSQLLAAAQVEVSLNVVPGGFMRGVRLEVRSTGGVIGTGAVAADGPWTSLASVSLENIDGAPIQYPMACYSHMIRNMFSRPWHGDPSRRFDFSNTVNPSFSLFMQPEIRQTAGVLANTDARSQYRIKYTFATATQFLGTVGTATLPTVTVTSYLESWAQPDREDLRGYPIEELPPGMQLSTLARHQVLNLSAVGADNTFQIANVGNEIRWSGWIMRNSAGARTDLASNPIRWRLDNRSLGTFGLEEVFNRMADFYELLQNGSTRPTGVYCWPRFYDPGRMVGEAWMATNNATYQIWETATAAGGAGGTIEIITDEVVPVGPVPMELESI
jgi:hypothetical protein